MAASEGELRALIDGLNTTYVSVCRDRKADGKFIDVVMFLNVEDADRWVALDPDNRRSRRIGVFNDYESYLKINPQGDVIRKQSEPRGY